jgi:hypothetical protein
MSIHFDIHDQKQWTEKSTESKVLILKTHFYRLLNSLINLHCNVSSALSDSAKSN